MEAPDKIYVHEVSAHELTEKLPYHIEYVRKDTFIKRISELLSSRIDYITYYHDKTEFVNEIIEDISEDIV